MQSPRTKAVQKQDGKFRKGKAQVIDLVSAFEQQSKIGNRVADTGVAIQQFLENEQRDKVAKEAKREARDEKMMDMFSMMMEEMKK